MNPQEKLRERAEKIIGRELDDFIGAALQKMLMDNIEQALIETRNEALEQCVNIFRTSLECGSLEIIFKINSIKTGKRK